MSHVHAGGLIWFQVGLTASLGLTALLYVRGSLGLRATSSTRRSGVARRQLSCRSGSDLGCRRLTAGNTRASAAHRPHDSASAADERGGPLDLAWCASHAAAARPAVEVRHGDHLSTWMQKDSPANRTDARAPCGLLDGRHAGARGVARARGVCARPAVERLASRPAGHIPGDRASVLVAGGPALAEHAHRTAMVDGAVSVSCDVAMRRLVRISGVLRTDRVSELLIHHRALSRRCS